jgi:hypothetical protein
VPEEKGQLTCAADLKTEELKGLSHEIFGLFFGL